MTRTVTGNITLLRPDDGKWLTNGAVFTDSVYLGKNADESEWRDATAEEYEAHLEAQEAEAEEAESEQPEEPTPAWDISQGEYIPEGFLLTRDGVEYACIQGHYAAWSKQPPNEIYWRQV